MKKCLGIDWGHETHALALVGPDGTVVEEWTIDHTPTALSTLLERLDREGGPAQVDIALEPGAALLLDRLYDAGYTLYPINPKQLDRFRDRHFPSGAKDDSRDALVAALALARDRDRLRPLQAQDALTEELVARARACQRLVRLRADLANQARTVLRRYFPALEKLERDMDDPFFLDLLKAYPDADAARRARPSRIQSLLKAHRIRALDVEKILAVFRAPAFPVRPHIVHACRDEIAALAAQIRQLNALIKDALTRMAQRFEEHPDRHLLLSLPGLGEVLAVRVGVRLGRDRLEHLDPTILQALGGTAPVTLSTGRKSRRRPPPGAGPRYGRKVVLMRRACDPNLQADLNQWAGQSVRSSRWAAACYSHLRRRGLTHNGALRTLANKWVKILAAVIRTNTAYDEERHVRDLVRAGVPWALALATPPETAAS